jgi:DNA invertase Pin-like site-specific DNA recombinase
MARKSRKADSTASGQANGGYTAGQTPTFNTALYVRLSIAGESIQNQQELLEQYVAQHPEFIPKGVFIDNGETGTDFNRPAWNDLMTQCNTGKINCIVVKDLSRLGRNYIETGDYLESIFPTLGVRIIAVTDGFDSLGLTNSGRLVLGLKNLANDIYAKDISRKIISAIHNKQKNGDFIGPTAAYGYLKDKHNKNRLVVNPETAPIVKQIFIWKAEGISNTAICRRLEAKGIHSPSKYKYLKGIITNPKFENSLWVGVTITGILRNTVYLGHMTQGKARKSLYEGRPRELVKREDWIIVKNTHEAIVTQELFDTANAVRFREVTA